MAHMAELMEIDDIESEFDDKENACQNNIFPTKANSEKSYEEFDISDMSMQLRYSVTPASSPMSKSFTVGCDDSKTHDRMNSSLNATIINATDELRSWDPKDCKPLAPKNLPTTKLLSSDISSLKGSLSMTFNSDLTNKNETTICVTNESDDSPYASSTSSPLLLVETQVSPTKEIPKTLGSPIMRGLKSVFNIFRSSQSPIPSIEIVKNMKIDNDTKNGENDGNLSGDNTVTEMENKPVLSSTPISDITKMNNETGSKRSNPHRESMVFNEDLVNELQWNEETTILFSNEKIPIHKLLFQQAHSASSPETNGTGANESEKSGQNTNVLDQTILLSDERSISFNEQEPCNNIVTQSNFMLPQYSTKEQTAGLKGNKEDDSEFLDCENTFTTDNLFLLPKPQSVTIERECLNNHAADLNTMTLSNCNITEVLEKDNDVEKQANENELVEHNSNDGNFEDFSSIVSESNLKDENPSKKQTEQTVISGPFDHSIISSDDILKTASESRVKSFQSTDKIMPILDKNNMTNLVSSDNEILSVCTSKMLNAETISREFTSQHDIQTLKKMALKIVDTKSNIETADAEIHLLTDLLKDIDTGFKNKTDDSLLKNEIKKEDKSEVSKCGNEHLDGTEVLIDPIKMKDKKQSSDLLSPQVETFDTTFSVNVFDFSNTMTTANTTQKEFSEKLLLTGLLKDYDTGCKNEIDDSLLKNEIKKENVPEVSKCRNKHLVGTDVLIGDIEMKDEKQILDLISPQVEIFDTTSSVEVSNCSNSMATAKATQKDSSEAREFEEELLMSENNSPYVSLREELVQDKILECGANRIKDTQKSLSLEIKSEDSSCPSSVASISYGKINQKPNEIIRDQIITENQISMSKQTRASDLAITSLISTATEVVVNALNTSIHLENFDTSFENVRDDFGDTKFSNSNNSKNKLDEVDVNTSCSEFSALAFVTDKSNCTSIEMKETGNSLAFNNKIVDRTNDETVGALATLVSTATEIVTSVISTSTQYVKTVNKTKGKSYDVILHNNEFNENIIEVPDVNPQVSPDVKTVLSVCIDKKDNIAEKECSDKITLDQTFTLSTNDLSQQATENVKANLEVNANIKNVSFSVDNKLENCEIMSKENDTGLEEQDLVCNHDVNENGDCCKNKKSENKIEAEIGALATLISSTTEVVINAIKTSTQVITDASKNIDVQNDAEEINVSNVGSKQIPEQLNIMNTIGDDEISATQYDKISAVIEKTNDFQTQMNNLHLGHDVILEKKTSTEFENCSNEEFVYVPAGTSSTESQCTAVTDFDNHSFNPFITKTEIQQSPPSICTIKSILKERYSGNLLNNCVSVDSCQQHLKDGKMLEEELLEVVEKNTNEINQSIEEEQFNFNVESDNSKDSDSNNVTVKEISTEDEDTIEGPFLEAGDFDQPLDSYLIPNIEKDQLIKEFSSEKNAFKQITNMDGEEDENFQSGEVFIDADAYEFFMNQNGHNIVNETGKESLFLKFDPLCANKVDANGISTVLNEIQKPLQQNSEQLNEHLPGPSGVITTNISAGNLDNNLNTTISQKPIMAVPPAINNDSPSIHPNKLVTPVRLPRQTMLSSPAIAVIDRLISINANSSPKQAINISPEIPQPNESETLLAQLKEALAAKELDIQQLHLESGELKDRLCSLESQMTKLEKDNEDKLRKINDLNETLAAKTKMNKNMAAVVEEYERTIAGLIAESEEEKKSHEKEREALIRERDEQTAHLGSMEVSFSDLHSKYEKSKQVILNYKLIEDKLRKSIVDYEDSFKKMQNNYELLKQHATLKLNNANQEFEKLNKAHQTELLKLNALIKRKELHITSLEETLSQKIKANEELTAICDELINRVG